ncbi:DNA polymerase III subunit alpha [bacterium]|nr:DNA polymerase III subunit alpha [bacterium]
MIHLNVRSWFSFLAGGSSPEQLAQRAAQLGQPALALTDLHGFYGAVRFARACKAVGVRPLFGITLLIQYPEEKPYPLLFLAENREGYADLCRLSSRYHQQGGLLHWKQVQAENVVVLTGGWESRLDHLLSQRGPARQWLQELGQRFPNAVYVEVTPNGRPGDRRRLEQLLQLGQQCQLPCLLSNAVRYAGKDHYARYDALTCVRLGITVGDPHPDRPVNDRAFLCSGEDLFQQLSGDLEPYMKACEQTQRVALRCQLDLLPEFVTPPTALLPAGVEPDPYLRELCLQGMARRYRPDAQAQALRQLHHELAVVQELELAEFFLVVREVTEFARSRGIRYAGRGSAANSIIAYLLSITTVDPLRHRLLFERFLHRGRRGMPDIDVDFDSERRAEVIAWMEQRFGEEHAAMTANVNTYQVRGAMREMMKVLGWDATLIDQVCQGIGQWDGLDSMRARRAEIEQLVGQTPLIDVLFALVQGIQHCPRHLSIHNGGVVLTRKPLSHFSPIQTSTGGYRQVQFDKDDVEALGLIKFDVLGLRMLAVLSEAVELHQQDCGQRIELDDLEMEDEPTFELIRSGQTMSLFQIESPGQMALLARTQPRNFSDLVIQVALFRPGPLQGGMVNPYLQRKAGQIETEYLHPSLASILADTHGIIVFQEQVLEICHQFAGLSLDEADEFRRLMSKWRDPGNMDAMGERFVEGARDLHGVSGELAWVVFHQVSAFVGYGFCRSHAAAFARTVFHSAYLKRHAPAAYMAAVLQHKPGFFPMSTILEEARRMGVKILPVCIFRSRQAYRVEDGAVRIPLTQVAEIHLQSADRIVAWAQTFEGDESSDFVWQSLLSQVPLATEQWESLARAGAFDSFGPRRRALWRVGVGRPSQASSGRPIRATGGPGARLTRGRKPAPPPRQAPLELDLCGNCEIAPDVPELRALSGELQMTWDYSTQGLSAAGHPMLHHRQRLLALGASTIAALNQVQPGRSVVLAGRVLIRQRPPTAKGMAFLMLEDETGRIQVAATPSRFQQYEATLSRAPSLLVRGKLEGTGGHRSVMLERTDDLQQILGVSLFQVSD